MINASVVSGLV